MKRHEKLACEALDLEQDADWSGAAGKWEEAARATAGPQQRDFTERAQRCLKQVKAPPAEPAPEPHLEHVEAAQQAENDGRPHEAVEAWKRAAAALERAGEAFKPLHDSFLARVKALQLQHGGGGGSGFAEIVVLSQEEPTAVACPGGSISTWPPKVEQDPPPREQTAPKLNKDRDPRLPPPGSTLTPANGPTGLVVLFTEHDLVVMESPERPEFIGERFPSVSGIARAFKGRHVNGYQWFGLKKPWAEALADDAGAFPPTTDPAAPFSSSHPAGPVSSILEPLTAETVRKANEAMKAVDSQVPVLVTREFAAVDAATGRELVLRVGLAMRGHQANAVCLQVGDGAPVSIEQVLEPLGVFLIRGGRGER